MAVHACVLFKKSTREETREETREHFLVNWIDTLDFPADPRSSLAQKVKAAAEIFRPRPKFPPRPSPSYLADDLERGLNRFWPRSKICVTVSHKSLDRWQSWLSMIIRCITEPKVDTWKALLTRHSTLEWASERKPREESATPLSVLYLLPHAQLLPHQPSHHGTFIT